MRYLRASILLSLLLVPTTEFASVRAITLKRVYQRGIPRLIGPFRGGGATGFLDSSGRYLFVADYERASISVIDWKVDSTISQRSLRDDLFCDQRNKTLDEIRLVPQANLVVASYCGRLFSFNSPTLDTLERLKDQNHYFVSDFDISFDGDYLIALVYAMDTKKNRLVLYRRVENSWVEQSGWHAPEKPVDVRFIPAGDSVVVSLWTVSKELRLAEDARKMIYKIPDGEIIHIQSQSSRYRDNNKLSIFSVLSSDPPAAIGIGRGIMVENLQTGELLRTIGIEENHIQPPLSVSADGQLVTAGTCDDPGDIRFCRLFKIWDIETGQVVYETQPTLADWNYWAQPNFSPDGNYLVVLKYNRVEIHQIIQH